MKWARFDGNRVIETTDIDPAGRFHPSLIWEAVPANVTPNSMREGDHWQIAERGLTDDEKIEQAWLEARAVQNEA